MQIVLPEAADCMLALKSLTVDTVLVQLAAQLVWVIIRVPSIMTAAPHRTNSDEGL